RSRPLPAPGRRRAWHRPAAERRAPWPPASSPSGLPPARYHRGLLHPCRHPGLVEVVLVDVDPARLLALAACGSGLERRAPEESHLDVPGVDVERKKPSPALDAVERRVPQYGLPHGGHG